MNISKTPCKKCKKSKEVEIKTQPYTKDEYDKIMPMLDKYGLTPQDMQYIYNFYNRVFGTNKQPGCGKCFINIAKQLKARYREVYG